MERELGWNSQYLSNALNSKLTPKKLPLTAVVVFGGKEGTETSTAWTSDAGNAQVAMARAKVNRRNWIIIRPSELFNEWEDQGGETTKEQVERMIAVDTTLWLLSTSW